MSIVLPADIDLPLSYKGQRTYVQGADIWKCLEEQSQLIIPGAYVADLAFHGFAHGACRVHFLSDTQENSFASARLLDDAGTQYPLTLVDLKTPLTHRVEFDEDELWQQLHIEGAKAYFEGRTVFSFQETVISMIKALSYTLAQPAEGAWIFVRAKLTQRPPVGWQSLLVEQVNAIPGRFSRNRIWVDSHQVGDIDFGVGKP